MIFLAILIAGALTVAIQYAVYKKKALSDLHYRSYFGSEEVFAGEDVYFYEELTNGKRLPVPYLKVGTDLPEGLAFSLLEEGEGEAPVQKLTGSIESVFVMQPYFEIKRRWRVSCLVRGEYELKGVVALANDILGFNPHSIRLEQDGEAKGRRLLVLPSPVDLAGGFTSSRYESGDVISNHCPVTDPLLLCGAREYTPSDAMNKINWKQSAVHGRLMVNVEERTVRHKFSLLLNMNSREIERDPTTPSDPDAIEMNVSVCASILDRIAREEVPVRVIMNTVIQNLPYLSPVGGDEAGSRIMISDPFEGRHDILTALRMLALLKKTISLPADKMFDHIAAYPDRYADSENLIVISSYLDQRLLNLHEVMKKHGVRVIYYITTVRRNIDLLPEGVEIYYKTY